MSRILVIDDERSIRNTLKDILEFEKYTVELAEDGFKALELLQQRGGRVVHLSLSHTEIHATAMAVLES